MRDKPLTRHGLKAGIQQGMTVEEIARKRDVTIVRVCLALEQFGMDYYQFHADGRPARKAG